MGKKETDGLLMLLLRMSNSAVPEGKFDEFSMERHGSTMIVDFKQAGDSDGVRIHVHDFSTIAKFEKARHLLDERPKDGVFADRQ